MDLQNYISHTPEYVKEFKKHKLNVRTYSKMGLMIVKCYRNNNYDYENHPWIRYCRGAVIDTTNDKVVCVPPMKSYEEENVNKIIEDFNTENTYQPLIDGTMINMFHHNDKWMVATRSNIGAKNSWDGKVSFYDMFMEVLGDSWFSKLDKNNCYSFVLHHKNNRNVTPIHNNYIFLVESYKLGDEIEKVNELPIIYGINNIIDLERGLLTEYSNDLIYSIKGFTVKTKNSRIKWLNPNFVYVSNLKMNHNDKFLNYIGLRQTRMLKEYLRFFPEDQYLFNEYRDQFNQIKSKLHESYLSHFVRKEREMKDIEYTLRPLIFELHGYYKETGEIITIKVVSDYMHNLPGKKMLFIKNRIFKC